LITNGGNSGRCSLTFDIVNGTANTVDVNSFALQLFGAGRFESFTVTSATLNGSSTITPWEFFADDKLNNGGTPDCSTTTVKGWLCGDTGQVTLSPYSIGSGDTAEFILSGNYSGTGPVGVLDLMARGCLVAGTCSLDGGYDKGDKWAVSSPMPSVATPEPSMLVLMGSGLSLIPMVIRRRRASKSK
jgi:hypothetical protein